MQIANAIKTFLVCAATILTLSLPSQAQAATFFNEDYEVTVGDITGFYGSGHNQTALDLITHGWWIGAGCASYCSAAIVQGTNHAGAPTRMLRYRYEEDQSITETCCSGHEAKLIFEGGHAVPNPMRAGYRDLWERYWLKLTPVPSNTVGCTPNCPTSAQLGLITSKQHYFRNDTSTGHPLPVTDFFFGGRNMGIAPQEMVDCGTWNGFPNGCPNLTTGAMPIQDNQWYCIETHIQFNSSPSVADGKYEMFVTPASTGVAVQTMNNTNRWFYNATHNPDATINGLHVYRQGAGYMWRFEDDFALGTTRIGCGAPSQIIYPTVTSVVTRANGATVSGTQSFQNPATTMLVVYGTNSSPTPTASTSVPIAQFPGWPTAGVYTFTWPVGTNYGCFTPQIADGTSAAGAQVCNSVTTTDAIAPVTPTGLTIR